MAFKDILVEKKGRIVCLTLNRPERMNSIGVETGNEMLEVFREYRDNPDLWVMIITAARDKSFCSGMYVTEAAQKTAEKGKTEGIPYTWTVLTGIQDTEDTKEGFRSFVEKRKPKFTGK